MRDSKSISKHATESPEMVPHWWIMAEPFGKQASEFTSTALDAKFVTQRTNEFLVRSLKAPFLPTETRLIVFAGTSSEESSGFEISSHIINRPDESVAETRVATFLAVTNWNLSHAASFFLQLKHHYHGAHGTIAVFCNEQEAARLQKILESKGEDFGWNVLLVAYSSTAIEAISPVGEMRVRHEHLDGLKLFDVREGLTLAKLLKGPQTHLANVEPPHIKHFPAGTDTHGREAEITSLTPLVKSLGGSNGQKYLRNLAALVAFGPIIIAARRSSHRISHRHDIASGVTASLAHNTPLNLDTLARFGSLATRLHRVVTMAKLEFQSGVDSALRCVRHSLKNTLSNFDLSQPEVIRARLYLEKVMADASTALAPGYDAKLDQVPFYGEEFAGTITTFCKTVEHACKGLAEVPSVVLKVKIKAPKSCHLDPRSAGLFYEFCRNLVSHHHDGKPYPHAEGEIESNHLNATLHGVADENDSETILGYLRHPSTDQHKGLPLMFAMLARLATENTSVTYDFSNAHTLPASNCVETRRVGRGFVRVIPAAERTVMLRVSINNLPIKP